MDRRLFLKVSTALSGSMVISSGLSGCAPSSESSSTYSAIDFTHGVASGDPTASAVVIWCRAVPKDGNAFAAVGWQVASDEAFNQIVRQGSAQALRSRDYTLKVDVQGLDASRDYFYRFVGASAVSPVGMTRTLPTGALDKVKFAVFSCSNYPAGFFNPYTAAAEDNEVDFVVHLGDYIYEYPADGYATEHAAEIGRLFNEDNQGELYSLADYRKRYATYRTDQGLLELHRQRPFIVVWDDHEVANDTYISGAENHTPEEGDFFERRAAAVQAYYEWLPIRPPMGETQLNIYRTFEFGDLLSLHMLDTRVIGRDKQLSYDDYRDAQSGEFDTQAFKQAISDPQRTLLGKEQKQWLAFQLSAAPTQWQVLGQQILMAKMQFPVEIFSHSEPTQIPLSIEQLIALKRKELAGETLAESELNRLNTTMAYNLDAWDGYPMEREWLYQQVQSASKPLVVLSGDTHNAWCSYLHTAGGDKVGIELATPGVSSPGMESYLGFSGDQATELAEGLPLLIAELDYCNLHQRGYLTVTFTPQQAIAEWRFVDTVLSPDFTLAQTHQTIYPAG